MPLFINRKNEKFDTPIDLAYLKQVQAHVVDLICSVIDTVTHMGWQFPGGAGTGQADYVKSIIAKAQFDSNASGIPFGL